MPAAPLRSGRLVNLRKRRKSTITYQLPSIIYESPKPSLIKLAPTRRRLGTHVPTPRLTSRVFARVVWLEKVVISLTRLVLTWFVQLRRFLEAVCDSMPAPEDLDSLAQAGANRLGNRFLTDADRSEIPPWFDKEKFDRGREFFRRHALSVVFSYFCSLYVGFVVDPLANAVVYTGESHTADRSRHRYLNTMGHLYCWHIHDVISDKASLGYRSIRHVRSWHDRVRRGMASRSIDFDLDQYVNQYDTAVTQVGFVSSVILYPRQFGIRCDDVELMDYVYFWRVVGYILGLDDEVNACGGDLESITTIADELSRRVIVPGLRNPTAKFLQLSESLIDGFRRFWPWLSSKIIRGFVFPIIGLPSPTDMTWEEYFIVRLLRAHFFLMYRVPWYASYWNGRIFKKLHILVPSLVVP